jgi:hypothetical protein
MSLRRGGKALPDCFRVLDRGSAGGHGVPCPYRFSAPEIVVEFLFIGGPADGLPI